MLTSPQDYVRAVNYSIPLIKCYHIFRKSTAPRLYTVPRCAGMSAGEARENYDAVRKSMEMG